MKILQVASALPNRGGIEKAVLHLAAGLQERGHEVDIAAIPESWVEQEAHKSSLSTVPLTVRRQHDFAALLPCFRLLREKRYDIINTHFSPDYLLPALAARPLKSSCTVMTRYHVKTWRGTKKWMYEKGLGYSKILAVSEAVRNALIAGGMAEEFVEVVYTGVPAPPQEPQAMQNNVLRQELDLAPDCVLAGIVSRIAPEKGHGMLLEAMRSVAENVLCLVVGEGPDRAKMEAFARENGLRERVRFLGWRTDALAVMNALDIIVQPSQWEEACSLSILEAMGCGKPLIVTESGGNAELVLHERTGLVVPKSSPAALAAALNTLAQNAALRDAYGRAAKARHGERFTVAAMAEHTEQAYLRLLSTDK